MSEKYNVSEEVNIETGKQYSNSTHQETRFWNNQQLSGKQL